MSKEFKFGSEQIVFDFDTDRYMQIYPIAIQKSKEIRETFRERLLEYQTIEDVCEQAFNLFTDGLYLFALQFKDIFAAEDKNVDLWEWLTRCVDLKDSMESVKTIISSDAEELLKLENYENFGKAVSQLKTDLRKRYRNFSYGDEWLYGAIGAGVKNITNYGLSKARQSLENKAIEKKTQEQKNRMLLNTREKILSQFNFCIDVVYTLVLYRFKALPGFQVDRIKELLNGGEYKNFSSNEKIELAKDCLLHSPITTNVYEYIFDNMEEDFIDDAIEIAHYFSTDISQGYDRLSTFDGRKFRNWHEAKWLKASWEKVYQQLKSDNKCSCLIPEVLSRRINGKCDNSKEMIREYVIYFDDVVSLKRTINVFEQLTIPEIFLDAREYVTTQLNMFKEIKTEYEERKEFVSKTTMDGVICALENNFEVGESSNIYVGRNISQRKLRNVLLGYAKGKGIKRKDVWLMWDSTTFGSGNEGFIVTRDRVVSSCGVTIKFDKLKDFILEGDRLVCKAVNKKGVDKKIEIAKNIPGNDNRLVQLLHYFMHPESMENNCLEALKQDPDGSIALQTLAERFKMQDDIKEEEFLVEKRKQARIKYFVIFVVLIVIGFMARYYF